MESSLINLDGEVVSKIQLPEEVFGNKVRYDIMHSVVCWQLAKRRRGTHQVKTRGAVKCSTRKIYRQKGTGRARHGASSANIFVGGGVVFGPAPRDYGYKLNKKLRFKGLCSALSEKFAKKSLLFIENLDLSSFKSSDFLNCMEKCKIDSALIVDAEVKKGAKFATANLHKFCLLPVVGLNVYDILKCEKLVFTVAGLKALKERVARCCHGL